MKKNEMYKKLRTDDEFLNSLIDFNTIILLDEMGYRKNTIDRNNILDMIERLQRIKNK